MRRNFQLLVVFHQCLIFATVVVQSLTDGWLSPESRGPLEAEGSIFDGAREFTTGGQVLDALWWPMMFVSLLASAGVLFFRGWARTLFASVSALGLLLIPLGGLYVDLGWTVLLGSLACIVEGMIIALMYFSPLRRMFRGVRET